MISLLFIVIFLFIYLHIYLHFRITTENDFITLDDICRKEITNTIYYKQPFYFDGTSIKHEIISEKKGIHPMIYESIPLLEPTVKFFPSSTIYFLKKNILETNLECRNFYYVHSGKVKLSCIHPKYSEHFVNKKVNMDFIHKMIHVELETNGILFLPNYWYILIEPLEKNTVIEKIQYKTILNQSNFIYKKLLSIL